MRLLEELNNNKQEKIDKIIKKTFERTNEGCREILQKANSLNKRIGSTGVIGLFLEQSFIVANVGDSRCVLSRDGCAHRISVDHKPLDEPERDRIRDLGG